VHVLKAFPPDHSRRVPLGEYEWSDAVGQLSSDDAYIRWPTALSLNADLKEVQSLFQDLVGTLLQKIGVAASQKYFHASHVSQRR